MVKKLSVLALAGMLALPTAGLAGGSGGDVVDLEKKIAELARQLDELRAAMAAQAEQNKALAENVQALDQNVGTLDQNVEQLDDDLADLDYRADDWDLAARFKLFGDFRSRLDLYNADTVFGRDVDNDTIWTNRFRLN
ncbi:MAG: hypothetical protein V2I32_15565, partial [Desulforhopalus sp.]|nr:hypothetical protein [Desulforhopalus sp.]